MQITGCMQRFHRQLNGFQFDSFAAVWFCRNAASRQEEVVTKEWWPKASSTSTIANTSNEHKNERLIVSIRQYGLPYLVKVGVVFLFCILYFCSSVCFACNWKKKKDADFLLMLRWITNNTTTTVYYRRKRGAAVEREREREREREKTNKPLSNDGRELFPCYCFCCGRPILTFLKPFRIR